MDFCTMRRLNARCVRIFTYTILVFLTFWSYVNFEAARVLDDKDEDARFVKHREVHIPPKQSGKNDSVLLTLFTTIRDVEFRRKIHETTIHNWSLLSPRIVPILFVQNSSKDLQNASSWAFYARRHGWRVVDYGRTGDDVPILKDMFQIVFNLHLNSKFVGYANADILFDYNLPRTLESISRFDEEIDNHLMLVTGRRCNVDIKHIHNKVIRNHGHPDHVTKVSTDNGVTFGHDSADYFIFSRAGFYWHHVPDFIVGRIGFDTWFLAKVVEWKIQSVDASDTINAVHQTGPDGNYASQNISRDQFYNHKLMPNFNYNPGSHNCAKLYTSNDMNCPAEVKSCPRVYHRTRHVMPWHCLYWKPVRFYLTRGILAFLTSLITLLVLYRLCNFLVIYRRLRNST